MPVPGKRHEAQAYTRQYAVTTVVVSVEKKLVKIFVRESSRGYAETPCGE